MSEVLWSFILGWILGWWLDKIAVFVLGSRGKHSSSLLCSWLSMLYMAVSFAGVSWMTSDIWDQITGSLLFLVLGVALWTDLSTRLIPDRLTLPAGGIFLLLGLVKGDGWISLIGFFVCGGLLLLIALLSQGGMGGGDMKLAAAAGAALGWPTAIAGLIGGIFLGGVAGGILLLTGKAGRGFALPFAPFLLIGFGGGFFVGDWLIQWYLSFFA